MALRPLADGTHAPSARLDEVVTSERRISRPPADGPLKLIEVLENGGLLSNVRSMDGPLGTDPLAVLLRYYAGSTDTAAWRRASDRVFLLCATDTATARSIVGTLAGLLPEMGPVSLERTGVNGQLKLALRTTKDIVNVESDTPGDLSSVAVVDIVRAFNAALGHTSLRDRFVPLACGDDLEIYAALPLRTAMDLCRASLLEGMDAEELVTFASW